MEKYINETHWDTLLTRPNVYLNKQVKMYHFSNCKKDVIIPITVNSGNKLAKPRFSSWWTPMSLCQGAWVIMTVLFSKFKQNKFKEISWTAGEVIDNGVRYKVPIGIISESFFKENKDIITNIDVYRHEKTFNGKDLGRGNEYSVIEYTCDFPVKPDNVVKLSWDDISNYLKIVPDNMIPKYIDDFNYMRLQGKNLQDMVHKRKPWLYWEFQVTQDIRRKYCQEHNIEFEVDEDYWLFTFNGQNLFKVIPEIIDNRAVNNINLKKFSLLSDNYSHYLTYDGMKLVTKKVIPIIIKKYGYKIDVSKIKNPKNIIYKDKYQIVVDDR